MDPVKEVVSVSIGSSKRDHEVEIELLGEMAAEAGEDEVIDDVSKLVEVLRHGACGTRTQLSEEDWYRLVTWIDGTCPSGISSKSRTAAPPRIRPIAGRRTDAPAITPVAGARFPSRRPLHLHAWQQLA